MTRNILVTGVSSGLGHGLAKSHLARGDHVIGCSRRCPDLLVATGLSFTHADFSSTSPDLHPLESLLARTPSLDVVYLNAAKLGLVRDMKDSPIEDLLETMQINVWSNKLLLDLLFSRVPLIRQVVAISSGASISGLRGWNGYALSKAALNMLVKLYAGENPNTHFTSLAPGLIDSPMQDYLTSLPSNDQFAPLEILKKAKGTDAMPDGETAARKIIDSLPLLLHQPSGSYQDIRKLDSN